MPAVITHDMFGRDIYGEMHGLIGDGRQECDAFLLGNQGPDVFFFSALNPLLSSTWGLGTRMHLDDPAKMLSTMRDAVNALVPEARPVGVAYMLGLVCHYILDSSLHPFIYAQQNAICEAGIDGLDHHDDHEVHAEIESELDVLTLTQKLGCTVDEFNPSKQTLKGDDDTLAIISFVYKRAVRAMYELDIPKNAFSQSVKAYRSALGALYSPKGIKRAAWGRAERLFRRHSFLKAMSHRNQLLDDSPFANTNNAPWIDPITLQSRKESYWQLYCAAQAKAADILPRFGSISTSQLDKITQNLNFNGYPTKPTILEIRDCEQDLP